MAVLNGDVLRVTANFELGDGTQYQNVYHYVRDGTDPFSDAVHVAAILAHQQAAYVALETIVNSDATQQLSFVDRVEFNEIVDEWRVVENIGTYTIAWTPDGVDDTLPYQSSPYVVFKTQRPKSVGKKFLFPITEDRQADTVMTGGTVTAIVAYAAQILTAIELGGDATLSGVIVRTGVQTVLPLLVAVVSDILGSQKRRRPGVGA